MFLRKYLGKAELPHLLSRFFFFLPFQLLPALSPFFFFFNFHESSQGDGLGTVTKDATVIKNQYEFLYYKPVNGSIIFLF